MKYIAKMLQDQAIAAKLSQEELENPEEVVVDEPLELLETPAESAELDEGVEEVAVAEDAVATMESMVEFIGSLATYSPESYTSSMQVVHGLMHTARLPVDGVMLSTEASDVSTDAQRKDNFAERVKGNAGKIKDAIVVGIRKLFAMLSKFFSQFFDRVERVKAAAATAGAALGDDLKFEVSTALGGALPKFGELKTVSAKVGQISVAAIKAVKASGSTTDSYDKLREVTKIALPSGLPGSPAWDTAAGTLNVDWSEADKGTVTVGGAVMRKAMDNVVEICDDILKQRVALKGTVLENDGTTAPNFKGDEEAKQFSQALKLINGLYKTWANYVGRLCALATTAAKRPVKEATAG